MTSLHTYALLAVVAAWPAFALEHADGDAMASKDSRQGQSAGAGADYGDTQLSGHGNCPWQCV